MGWVGVLERLSECFNGMTCRFFCCQRRGKMRMGWELGKNLPFCEMDETAYRIYSVEVPSLEFCGLHCARTGCEAQSYS